MKFIKLTRADKWNEGKPVYINTNCIVAVFEFEENKKCQTRVTINDADGGYFDVRENLEEIMAMIEGEIDGKEVIIKVLDDEEMKPQFSQDGNVYRATLPSPYVNMGELIRCKDCKHRPTIDGEYENGFDLEFPTGRCPCQCDDGYYNWMPKDDWYCANGERKEI